MKIKFQVLIAFCIITLSIKAQHWYPENAHWIFNKQELLSFPAHGYVKYRVVEDTVLNDKTAKLITFETLHYDGSKSVKDSLFVHESNSRVYLWNGNQFKLMYDFNLNVGDTLDVDVMVNNCDSVSPIVVDSVSYLNLNGHDLKVQHLSYTLYAETQYGYNSEVSEQIIERIGSREHFIFSPSCVIDDEFTYSGLRCYNDNNIFYKDEWWKSHFPEVGCDSLLNITTDIHKLDQSEFLIFPNPSNDVLRIESGKETDNSCVYQIFNTRGMSFKEGEAELGSVNISDLAPGIYFIRISSKSGRMIYSARFVKN